MSQAKSPTDSLSSFHSNSSTEVRASYDLFLLLIYNDSDSSITFYAFLLAYSASFHMCINSSSVVEIWQIESYSSWVWSLSLDTFSWQFSLHNSLNSSNYKSAISHNVFIVVWLIQSLTKLISSVMWLVTGTVMHKHWTTVLSPSKSSHNTTEKSCVQHTRFQGLGSQC